jgi:hypothetical protein
MVSVEGSTETRWKPPKRKLIFLLFLNFSFVPHEFRFSKLLNLIAPNRGANWKFIDNPKDFSSSSREINEGAPKMYECELLLKTENRFSCLVARVKIAVGLQCHNEREWARAKIYCFSEENPKKEKLSERKADERMRRGVLLLPQKVLQFSAESSAQSMLLLSTNTDGESCGGLELAEFEEWKISHRLAILSPTPSPPCQPPAQLGGFLH